MTRDFTHDTYTRLLKTLLDAGYQFLTFGELATIETTAGLPHSVLLRHDVDRMPRRALAMAEVEGRHGVRATYFFRTKRVSFHPSVMRRIRDLGHEIGYHYESLADSDGDFDKAWQIFELDSRRFDFLGGVASVAMHGRPLSSWDSRDLWKYFDYRDLGIKSEAYIDTERLDFTYFTDTGRSWCSGFNIRDFMRRETGARRPVCSTAELCSHISSARQNLVISAHPERWTSSLLGWCQAYIFDSLVNSVKAAALTHASRSNR